MITAEEFFRNKLIELRLNVAVITLANEIITAEQAMRWAHEFADKFKNKADKWDKLGDEIDKYYNKENESTEEEEGSLLDIGQSGDKEEIANAKLITTIPELLETIYHGLRLAKSLPNKESIGVRMFIKAAEKVIEKALT